jgi:hypothetical protein
MNLEQLMEWKFSGETGVLGENPFSPSHMGSEPARRGGKPANNRLSYSAFSRISGVEYKL